MSRHCWLRFVGACVLCVGLCGCGGVEEVGPVEAQPTSEEALKAKEAAMQQYKEHMDKFPKGAKLPETTQPAQQ